MDSHINEQHVEGTSCTQCEFDGNNKEDLEKHLGSNHNTAEKQVTIAGGFVLTEFFCKHCDFTAETEDAVSEHVLQNHAAKDMQTEEQIDVAEVPSAVVDVPEPVFEVPLAAVEVPIAVTGVDVDVQIIEDTDATVKYNCGKCPFSSETKDVLNEHIGRKHNIIGKFKCDKCANEFNEKEQLTKHIFE